MTGSNTIGAAILFVLMGSMSVSSCESTSTETLQAHFIPWNVLTRYRYTSEDLTNRSETKRRIETERALQISNWISSKGALEACSTNDLDARFLIMDADDRPLILADKFCLCALEEEKCVSNTDEMKSKIELWVR